MSDEEQESAEKSVSQAEGAAPHTQHSIAADGTDGHRLMAGGTRGSMARLASEPPTTCLPRFHVALAALALPPIARPVSYRKERERGDGQIRMVGQNRCELGDCNEILKMV